MLVRPWAFLAGIFLLAAPLSAAGAEEGTQESKKIIGVMLDNYATIAGAWYLEKKCHFLSEELLQEYEENIAYSTVHLHTTLGTSKDFIHKMQEAGQRTALDYQCDDKSRDIVVSTVVMARKLRTALEKIKSEQKN